MILLAAPLALIWFVRATVNHARSFEDALRRIEQIEGRVNNSLGEQVLSFQTLHPSRKDQVGGRISRETVSTVLATAYLLVAAVAFRMDRSGVIPLQVKPAYLAGLGIVGVLTTYEALRLRQYRYLPVFRLFSGE